MIGTKTFSKELTEEVEKLFKLGAHLGHKKNRLHPRARRFVYKIINGASIIDLTLTVSLLTEAKRVLTEQGKDNKNLLVVATKKVINQFASNYCAENGVAYITSKWLPGLLTNFETIIKNVKKLKDLKSQRDAGEWDKFVKHERMKLEKQVSKLEKLYGGISDLTKKPDVIFCVDTKKESNAVGEAQKNDIPLIAIVDTNSNPDMINHPIVMNDDSPELVEYIIKQLIDAYVKGKKEIKEKTKEN